MASGDIRFTPRYQFWATTILMAIAGAGLGWMFGVNGIGATLARLAYFSPIIAGISWFFRRTDYVQARKGVEPYEHPILGLYAGLAATVTMLISDESLGLAAITGAILGAIMAIVFIASRRWRTRNDPPGRQRPVPTISGWR